MASIKNATPVEEELEDVLTPREELEEVALLYRTQDVTEKTSKKEKELLRPALLDLISEVVREEITLQRRTETVPLAELEPFEYDPKDWQKKNFPEWTVVNFAPGEEAYEITLEENDKYRKFSFTVGGYKFGRTFKMVGSSFNAEAFANEVPKLEGISRPVLKKLIDLVEVKTVTVYDLDEDAATKLMNEHPETMAIIQKYNNPGEPQVSLLPITKAKEDEE